MGRMKHRRPEDVARRRRKSPCGLWEEPLLLLLLLRLAAAGEGFTRNKLCKAAGVRVVLQERRRCRRVLGRTGHGHGQLLLPCHCRRDVGMLTPREPCGGGLSHRHARRLGGVEGLGCWCLGGAHGCRLLLLLLLLLLHCWSRLKVEGHCVARRIAPPSSWVHIMQRFSLNLGWPVVELRVV